MNKQPWIETYDVVMPILKRDWPAAQVNLPFVFKNLPIRRLVEFLLRSGSIDSPGMSALCL